VAFIHSGPEKGKAAVIVNVVDHKRVLLDSPKEQGDQSQFTALKRQVYPTRHLRLSKYRLVIRHDENHEVISGLWAKNNLTRRLLASKYMIRKAKTEKVRFCL
jgi:ribosomal protein L14E/L6E/L27E